MLIRVKKQDVVKNDYKVIDPLGMCLDYWKSLMRMKRNDLGMQIVGFLECDRDGYIEQDYDPTLAELKQINFYGGAVDACMSGLPKTYRDALWIKCGICKVWRHYDISYKGSLFKAEKLITQKLKKNIATSHLF